VYSNNNTYHRYLASHLRYFLICPTDVLNQLLVQENNIESLMMVTSFRNKKHVHICLGERGREVAVSKLFIWLQVHRKVAVNIRM